MSASVGIYLDAEPDRRFLISIPSICVQTLSLLFSQVFVNSELIGISAQQTYWLEADLYHSWDIEPVRVRETDQTPSISFPFPIPVEAVAI